MFWAAALVQFVSDRQWWCHMRTGGNGNQRPSSSSFSCSSNGRLWVGGLFLWYENAADTQIRNDGDVTFSWLNFTRKLEDQSARASGLLRARARAATMAFVLISESCRTQQDRKCSGVVSTVSVWRFCFLSMLICCRVHSFSQWNRGRPASRPPNHGSIHLLEIQISNQLFKGISGGLSQGTGCVFSAAAVDFTPAFRDKKQMCDALVRSFMILKEFKDEKLKPTTICEALWSNSGA